MNTKLITHTPGFGGPLGTLVKFPENIIEFAKTWGPRVTSAIYRRCGGDDCQIDSPLHTGVGDKTVILTVCYVISNVVQWLSKTGAGSKNVNFFLSQTQKKRLLFINMSTLFSENTV